MYNRQYMECKICQRQAKLIKTLTVRQKYQAEYYMCDFCGFMFVGQPSWLKEAYEKSINITDTGYVTRNVYLSKKTLVLFSFIFGTNFTYLDYAGGYGMLARLMRDYGLNFLTLDPHTPNLFAQGFEYNNEEIKAVTCFECFEHFVSPILEIEKILKISKNIFFSTYLLPEKEPGNDWGYFGTEHGQHISFYSLKTLKFLAEKYKLNLYTDKNNMHFLTTKKIGFLTFKTILFLSRLQIDILIRKILNSKTTSDYNFLRRIQ